MFLLVTVKIWKGGAGGHHVNKTHVALDQLFPTTKAPN